MLEISNLHAYYGKSHVLHGVNMQVGQGEIVALLGRNGSGRSTTAKAIMGLVDCDGSVRWKGQDIQGKKPFEVAHLGIGYVPENRDIFPKLTVHQNLLLGQKGSGKGSRWSFDDMYAMFPRLKERQKQSAGTLSGGEQQMLAIGRALMSKPRCLMLDEPSLGIAPLLVKTIFEKIVEVNRDLGITILLVEQNANLALEVSHFGYVLETGAIILANESKALRQNEKVRECYLGG